MIKSLLVTSGYPRSGNTYLNQALNLLYYPEQEVNLSSHSAKVISKPGTIIVPLRNPLDAISSWHKFPLPSTMLEDVNFYIRFYSTVVNNLHKVCLMDFNKFTVDVDYIKDQIFKHFKINASHYVSDFDVKKVMIENEKENNLPRNNQEELQAVKKLISNTEGFDTCLELYNKLI